MRARSASSAPPERREDGSTASAATVRPPRPPRPHELAEQRRLAGARRPGDPDDVRRRLAAERRGGDLAQERGDLGARGRRPALHEVERRGRGGQVAPAQPRAEVCSGAAHRRRTLAAQAKITPPSIITLACGHDTLWADALQGALGQRGPAPWTGGPARRLTVASRAPVRLVSAHRPPTRPRSRRQEDLARRPSRPLTRPPEKERFHMATTDETSSDITDAREPSRSTRPTRPAARRSCSSTASGCCRAAGTAGRTVFEEAGYAPLHAGLARRPGDRRGGQGAPRGVRPQDGRRRSPTTSRTSSASSTTKPAVIGHSFGGLLDPDPRRPRPVRGVGGDRPGAVPRRAAAADLGAASRRRPVLGNPANRNRAVPLTYEQFRYAFANAVERGRGARSCTTTYAVPGAGRSRCSRPRPPTSTRGPRRRSTPKNPDRGPLLIISGEKDHTVPWAIANASYKQQKRQPGRHRDRRDPGPRPLADDRQRLARGRRHRAGVRQALRLAIAPGPRASAAPGRPAARPGPVVGAQRVTVSRVVAAGPRPTCPRPRRTSTM